MLSTGGMMRHIPWVTGVATFLLLALTLLVPYTASAKKIYSPIVERGEVALEYVLDVRFDGDQHVNQAARHQFELEYAMTSRWLTAIYGDFSRLPKQKFRYRGVKWENIYQLTGEGEHWLDAGVYLEYILPAASTNQADAIEFKMLLEKKTNALQHTFNITWKKELGAHAAGGMQTGYAWRTRWQWLDVFEPAIEYYASLGRLNHIKSFPQQSHQLGPVLHGHIAGAFSYELGYLFGLTSSSDRGALKLIVGYAL